MVETAKSFIKSAFPPGGWIYRRIRRARHALNLLMPSMAKVFSAIYLQNTWADPESVSGRGSTLAHTGVIRRELPALLESVGAKSLLDAACGDFNWMRHVDLRGVEYLGADVVPQLIARNRLIYPDRNFIVLDITHDELPQVDVILCRDCLIHHSLRDARACIANFKRSGSAFLFATTHTTVRKNTDIESGGWRPVNLQLPPYNLPAPLQLIVENAELGKHLGVWSLKDL